MSNRFEFVKQYNYDMFQRLKEASELAEKYPMASVGQSRACLELILDEYIDDDYIDSYFNTEKKIFGKIKHIEEYGLADERIISKMHYIRKRGNRGVHNEQVSSFEATGSVADLVDIFKWYIEDIQGITINNSYSSCADSSTSYAYSSGGNFNTCFADAYIAEQEKQNIKREQQQLQQEAIDKRIEEESREREVELETRRRAAQERIARMEEIRKEEQKRASEALMRQQEAKRQLDLEAESKRQEYIAAKQKEEAAYEAEAERQREEQRKFQEEVKRRREAELKIQQEQAKAEELIRKQKEFRRKLYNETEPAGYSNNLSTFLSEAKTYYYGLNGFNKDYKKAFELFTEASKLGSAEAFFFLGLCYQRGYGVSKNLSIAIEHFENSRRLGYDANGRISDCRKEMRNEKYAHIVAETGHKEETECQSHCESELRRQEYIAAKQKEKAVYDAEIRRQHEEQRKYQEEAKLKSELEYKQKQEKIKRQEEAKRQLEIEARCMREKERQRDAYIEQLKQLELEEQRRSQERAKEYLEEKALQQKFNESPEGLLYIGKCYYHATNGYKEDRATAVSYFLKASEKNNGEAYYLLGECYQYGFGVPVNYRIAKSMYTKALSIGYYGYDISNRMKQCQEKLGTTLNDCKKKNNKSDTSDDKIMNSKVLKIFIGAVIVLVLFWILLYTMD